MKFYYLNIVSLVLFVSTLTGALILDPHIAHRLNNQPNCGEVCPRSLPEFLRPEAGNTYVYNLESNTLINVKETQTVGVKAKVEITPHNACQFTLRLREVQLSGIPDTKDMTDQLELNPLEFGSFDGKVLGVCPADNEESWVLNVKKSILSALQMSAKTVTEATTVHEDDFSGHCMTTYTPLKSDDSSVTTLEKTKSLNKCEYRRKNLSGFNSRSLSMLTEFLRKSLPIMKSASTCTQQLQNGIITSVICIEENRLSYQESSLVSSSLNLKFAEKKRSTSAKTQTNTAPQNLFITENKETLKEAVESDVLSLLGTICSQISGDNLSPEITKSFHTLVQSLKSLSESATQRIDTAVKSGEICSSPKLRDLFIGASAFASSDASIQTIVNAYNNKEFTVTRGTILFSLIALKSKPTEKAINALLPLLESKETARPLVLGISLLIRNFCEKNEVCEEIPVVKRSVDILLTKLRNSDCNLERITYIKSLDNIIQKSSDLTKNSLLAVITNTSMDSGVRVAAIQAITKISDNNIREKLIEILLLDTEDVDVRVTAYKSVVMSEASAEQLEKIRSEKKDSKIETYIRTHMRNLMKSGSWNRRRVLGQNPPKFEDPNIPKIPIGITRNIEFSYRGATIEADVIHPKGSLVPSLLSLNVWLPDLVKGKDLQLLEINIRHVGLDAHIKKVMGRGIVGPEITLRLAEELLEFIEHLKDPNHIHTTILQITVRISGKNVLFIDTFEDLHVFTKLVVERLRDISKLDTLDRALGAVILDSVVEIPTLTGFPMIVHLNETAVVGIKASLNTEATDPNSKTRKIRSNRSVMAELSAGLNLQVGNYRPGFEYKMQFSFTPLIDALIETKDSRMIKVKFNLSKDKETLLKLVQKTRLIDSNGLPKESNEVSDNGQESEENTRCKERYGLSICRVRTPLEDSPLPNVEIYISKKDKSMEAIELVLEAPPKLSKEVKTWIVRMNATNSEVNRELSAELQLLTPSEGLKEARLKLRSPTMEMSSRASLLGYRGNNTEIEIEMNCPKHIEIKLKHIVEKTADQRNVNLTIDYKLHDSKPESIKFIERVSFNLKRNKKTKIINVSLFGELNATQFPQYNSQISYYTQLKPYQHSKSELTIGWNQDFKDRIRVSHTSKMDVTELRPFKMISENALIVEATPYDINYDFKLNTDISLVKNSPKHLKFDLVGKDVNGREDKDIRGSFEFQRTESPLQQTLNVSLKYPGRELAYSSEVHQIKDMEFEGSIRYQLQKGKVVTVKHKESITNPTKDFKFESNSETSYSYKSDKYSYSTVLGWVDSNTFEYKYSVLHNAKKYLEWLLSATKSGQFKAYAGCEERSAKINVDNVFEPKSAEIEIKNDQKLYKLKSQRVPKESITFRLDSAQNSRLKELEIHISIVDKSSIKLLTSEGLDMKGYIDPISENKRAHIQIESPKRGYSHIGDIKYLGAEQKLVIDSKTNKSGIPYITIEGELSCKDKSFLIAKKIKSVDEVSKFEYFYDKGSYGLVIESSKFTAFAEGENKEKKSGKLGFFDKVHNYEHTSNYSVENGVITIKSISNKDKETFTRLDAVLGLRQVSNITLITPTINSKLIVNPLGEKKTLNFNWISPTYDQKTVIEVVPKKEIKIESLTQRKVEPLKTFKVDGLIIRNKESSVRISAPALDVTVRRTVAPKPQYIFNTTLNGYNEIQEFDVNQNLHPVTNLVIALYKYLKSYTVSD